MSGKRLGGRIALPVGRILNEQHREIGRSYKITGVKGAGAFSIVYEAEVMPLTTERKESIDSLKQIEPKKVAIKEFYSLEFSIRNELGQVVANEGLYVPRKSSSGSSLSSKTKTRTKIVSNDDGHKWALDKAAQEIKILKKINHKNVAKYIDSFTENETHYLVMELYNRNPMTDFTNDLISVENKLKAVAEGVAQLHYRDYVHRDLHPGNILWDKDDNPVIIDFGLAMSCFGAIDEMMIIGSPYSPESYDGYYGYDTDLYSVGAIAYKWIHGLAPHMLKNRNDNLLLKVSKNSSLNNIVERAMRQTRFGRYRNVEHLVAEFPPDTQVKNLSKRLKKFQAEAGYKEQESGAELTFHESVQESKYLFTECFSEVKDLDLS